MNMTRAVIISAAVAAAVLAACAASCVQEKLPGAEETLKMFYREMLDGNRDKAEELCDSTGADGYLTRFFAARELEESTDSTLLDVATAILGNCDIKITDRKNAGRTTTLYFELTFGNNIPPKKKIAEMGKEKSGRWMIRKITERPEE